MLHRGRYHKTTLVNPKKLNHSPWSNTIMIYISINWGIGSWHIFLFEFFHSLASSSAWWTQARFCWKRAVGKSRLTFWDLLRVNRQLFKVQRIVRRKEWFRRDVTSFINITNRAAKLKMISPLKEFILLVNWQATSLQLDKSLKTLKTKDK